MFEQHSLVQSLSVFLQVRIGHVCQLHFQMLLCRLSIYTRDQTYLDFDELIRVLLVDTFELLEVRFELLNLILRSLQLSTNCSNLVGT